MEKSGRHGWYARVLQEGTVEAGMALALRERPNPEWSVRRAADVYRTKAHDNSAATALARVTEFAERPRRQLERAIARTQAGKPGSE